MGSSLAHATSLHQVQCKSDGCFLLNTAVKQTNRQTDPGETLTSLAAATMVFPCFSYCLADTTLNDAVEISFTLFEGLHLTLLRFFADMCSNESNGVLFKFRKCPSWSYVPFI